MNATFNIKRFGNLAKREFTYSWKTFMYIIMGFVVYFITAQLLDAIWQMQLLNLLPVAAIALIICGAPFTDKSLNKTNSMSYFTTPASNFERWLLLWIKVVLLLPVLVIGIIFLFDAISTIPNLKYIVDTKHIVREIYFLFAFQSIFFFGYIYFRGRSLVKTAIAITILFLLIQLISSLIIGQLYPEVSAIRHNMNAISILTFDGFYNYNREIIGYIETGTNSIYEVCSWIIKLIFPLGLWVVSYFRLRETEIK